MSEKPVIAFGENFVFHRIPYSGQATTFVVDQRATSAAVVAPVSGPSVSIAAAVDNSAVKVITLAAGGANQGGHVIVVTAYGKSRAGFKPA